MSTFLAICIVIFLLTLPFRIAASTRRRRQAIAALAARPAVVAVVDRGQMMQPAVSLPARLEQTGYLNWGPGGSR